MQWRVAFGTQHEAQKESETIVLSTSHTRYTSVVPNLLRIAQFVADYTILNLQNIGVDLLKQCCKQKL